MRRLVQFSSRWGGEALIASRTNRIIAKPPVAYKPMPGRANQPRAEREAASRQRQQERAT